MKRIAFPALLFIIACSGPKPQPLPDEPVIDSVEQSTQAEPDQSVYKDGEEFSGENAIPVGDLFTQMGEKPEMEATITGEITQVCQVKGCWMKVLKPDSSTMRVTFKDYGFFVPLDASGKTAVMKGIAKLDTSSVEDLRHYAKDAGKSEEEIALITEPEINVSFVASGVVIK